MGPTAVDIDTTIASLRANGQLPPMPRREWKLVELTWRHRAVIHLMIVGLADVSLLAFVKRTSKQKIDGVWREVALAPPEPGEPLSIFEAGRLLGLRIGYCRALADKPVFKRALREARRAADPAATVEFDEEENDDER